MDSKNVVDPRLADLLLGSYHLAAVVSDIPGASIVSDNVELDLSKFKSDTDEVEVVQARFGSEIASISETSGVATLDFTSVVAATDLIEIDVRVKFNA
jgi:hypothetical protein